jgi:hypothetical protein
MMAAERDTILAVINASVLLAYFLYGFPGDAIPPPLAEVKYEPFTHYRQKHLDLNINILLMMVLWSIYKWLAFRKYLEENLLTPTINRKVAKCAAHILGVLRSIGGIFPIGMFGMFLAMHLQWLLHTAFKALPAKAAFAKGFNKSKANDRWPTTTLGATGNTRFDVEHLCTTLTVDQHHTLYCHIINVLVERRHTSEGWSDACYKILKW